MIRIDSDELYSLYRIFNHAVHGIVSCTANADHYDPCSGLGLV